MINKLRYLFVVTFLLFSFQSSNILAQQLERGPYLQQGAPSSIIIKWRTSSPENSRVTFGLTNDTLSEAAENLEITTEHEIKITGLSPNTKYYYKIGSQSSLYESRPNQYFKTAPNIGEEKPFRTWILGDAGTRTFRQRAVRDGYLAYSNSVSPDITLLLGDNAYNDGSEEEYQGALFENMYESILVNSHLWSSTGNHDLNYGNAHVFYGIFSFPINGELGGTPSQTEEYYSFDYGNVHFVTIESSQADNDPNGVMAEWLKKDLANTNQTWKIVYFHHPVYSDGHDSDDEKDLIELRQNFVPIIEQYNVDLVLNGHSHRYERTGLIKGHHGFSNTWNPSTMAINNGFGQENNGGVYDKTSNSNGTVYVTTGNAGKFDGGTTGKPVHKFVNGDIGSGVLEINGKKLDYKQIDENGNVIDFFTIIRGTTTNPDPDPTPNTTISVAISSGNDDVEEINGSLNTNSSDLELAYDHSELQVIGLRFKSLNIPPNAIINSAFIQFTADESNNTTSELEIALHDSPNSPEFSYSNVVSTRNTFSSKITWNPSSWSANQSTDAQRTPDLKNMVQSLINKTGWSSGNNASFIITAKGISITDTNAKRVADSYEGGSNKAAKLIINYTINSNPNPDPVAYCTSNSTNLNYEFIKRVQLGTIDNITDASPNGYNDFTNFSSNLISNNTITITPSWPRGDTYKEAYAVWIDFNHNGDFSDDGELVFSKIASKDPLVSGSFSIPLNAIIGTTKMRVSMKYNGIPTSCETFTYGEVEDYSVAIGSEVSNILSLKNQTTPDNNTEIKFQILQNPVKKGTPLKVSIFNQKSKNNPSYTIINLSGQTISNGHISTSGSIPLKGLQSGLYILQVKIDAFKIHTQFIVE